MSAAVVGRGRIVAGISLIAVFVAAGIGYLGWRVATTQQAAAQSGVQLDRSGTLLYVEPGSNRVRQIALGGGDGGGGGDGSAAVIGAVTPVGVGPVCQRVYAGGGTMACLRATAVPMASELDLINTSGKVVKTLQLWGNPSRVRVSPSGHLAAWTVFRSGDSYLMAGAFSTTAGIYDLRTGTHYGSLEDFTASVGGQVYSSADVNYWGVTFGSDDEIFYATMASKGKTWLMRGNLQNRTLTAVRENVECPSLSPDGTRIAYKFRNGKTWRLHVLTLATHHDVALAETSHIDDQPAWINDKTVAYSKQDSGEPGVFVVPADGSGQPRKLVAGSSPAAW
ncbi:TolB family protein [Kribbella sp. NPDC051620]|uniref:TolB family protein n=1 Tax=Kribbella sp. NPDC051620 TaxID=3364120 RepID=UPI0037B15D94